MLVALCWSVTHRIIARIKMSRIPQNVIATNRGYAFLFRFYISGTPLPMHYAFLLPRKGGTLPGTRHPHSPKTLNVATLSF